MKILEVLQDRARHIDFAGLRQLTLGGCLDAVQSGVSGEVMEWTAQTLSFPNVKFLSIRITRDDFDVEKPCFSEQAISFFRTFRSLEQLCIQGPIDNHIVDSVLAHHGQTLRS